MSVVRIGALGQQTNRLIASATGFLTRYASRHFLVTNWHVASGRHWQTKQTLKGTYEVPGVLSLKMHVRRAPPPEVELEQGYFLYGGTETIDIEIDPYDELLSKSIHPKYGHDVDVVALPLDDKIEHLAAGGKTVSPIELPPDEVYERMEVMSTVSMPGYPELTYVKAPNPFPVYKAAFVASEPKRFDHLPFFFR